MDVIFFSRNVVKVYLGTLYSSPTLNLMFIISSAFRLWYLIILSILNQGNWFLILVRLYRHSVQTVFITNACLKLKRYKQTLPLKLKRYKQTLLLKLKRYKQTLLLKLKRYKQTLLLKLKRYKQTLLLKLKCLQQSLILNLKCS